VKAPYRSVLCPTDLTALGNLAVPVAYLLAAPGATVHLLHVDAPPKTGNPLYPDEKPKGAPTAAQLAAAKDKVRAQLKALVPADAAAGKIVTEFDLVEGEDVTMAIQSEARARKTDVIVLGSYGSWGLSRVVHGESVAMRLLHQSDLDVIVVHSDKP
jgi:nucleotide-binding universal stress UspA family protein